MQVANGSLLHVLHSSTFCRLLADLDIRPFLLGGLPRASHRVLRQFQERLAFALRRTDGGCPCRRRCATCGSSGTPPGSAPASPPPCGGLPPWLNTSMRSWQCGQFRQLMFCHDSQDRHSDLAEHGHRLTRILERDIGWRGSPRSAPVMGAVCIGESCTSLGARRKIDDEVVQIAPVQRAQELLDDAVQHGAAPH